MKNLNKKLIVAGIAGAVIVFAGVASTTYVIAQAVGNSNSVFNRVAQILGISEQKLSDAFKQASTENVDQAVKDGKLTQQQADQINQNIANGNFGHMGRGFGAGMGMGRFGMGFDYLGEIANYLSISRQTLMTDLQSGQKLTDIITGQGKTVADVKTDLTQKVSDYAKQQVSSGKWTQAQADNLISKSATSIDNILNGTFPQRPFRFNTSPTPTPTAL